MRITIDLPENLLEEAKKVADAPTNTGAIIFALEELIRKSKISGLKRHKGKVNIILHNQV